MNIDYQQIDQYIQGKLTGDVLAEFEAQLLVNKELALYKDVNETLETSYAYEQEDAALAQTFQQLGKKYFSPKTGTTIEESAKDTMKVEQDNTKVVPLRPVEKKVEQSKSSNLRWLRPVIGLAIAALIALLIFQPWQKGLILPFDEPYQLAALERSSGEAGLIAAQKAYNAGDYATALPVFEQYPDKADVQIAKANAEYYLGKTDAAIRSLEQVASGGTVYTSTAKWYLSGVYLQQDQTEKAKSVLQTIKSGTYYEKAQALLKTLK